MPSSFCQIVSFLARSLSRIRVTAIDDAVHSEKDRMLGRKPFSIPTDERKSVFQRANAMNWAAEALVEA